MGKIRILGSTVLAAVAIAGSPATAANLLINGSFEQPGVPGSCCTTTPPDSLPGWTVPNGDVNVVIGTFASSAGNLAFEGNQYLDLIGQQPTGSLAQTFATTVGKTYVLNLAYSHNLFGGSPSASASFSVAGLSGMLTHTGGSNANLAWTSYSNTFTATSTATTLRFDNLTGGQNAGLLLDAVSVSAVPEPSAWALFILGFGIIGAGLRRKSSRNFVTA